MIISIKWSPNVEEDEKLNFTNDNANNIYQNCILLVKPKNGLASVVKVCHSQ